MTKEEKVAWLREASVTDLLRQFETSARENADAFAVSRCSGRPIEEIFEDYELTKAELVRRMGSRRPYL